MDNQQFQPVQNQSIWTIILPTIIITALIAGGGIWWWQKSVFEKEKETLQQQIEELESQIAETGSDQFADWKTYRNEEYGYEIKYPANTKIYGEKTSVFFDVNGQSNGHFSSIYGPIVKIMKGDILEEISTIKANAKELEPTGIDQIIEEKQLVINGVNVNKIVIASAIGYNMASYYFAGDDINYLINTDNDNPIHNDIVSTFKFTD